MIRVAKMYHPPSGSELRGKHVPAMLILGPLGPMQKELIPALFRIAGDHEIRHVDITHSPDALDPERLKGYTLIFVAFEVYRDNVPFFRLLPDSILSRITVLAEIPDFPSVDPEVRCACYSPALKALVPREEAQILDPRHSPGEDR